MNKQSSSESTSKEMVWLIGFIIDPDCEEAQLYTIFFPGDVDEPLMQEVTIIFFSNPQLAKNAIESGDNKYQNFIYPPADVDMVCNIAEMLYLINHEDTDTTASLIDGFNILFDMIKAIKIDIPPEYRPILHAFADHLTFHQEFASFFETEQTSRLAITNALQWCIGAIVSRGKVVG